MYVGVPTRYAQVRSRGRRLADRTSLVSRPSREGRGLPEQGATVARIEFHDLSKRYGAVTAVDSLTFAPTPGRITGFVGANGAGKSTTIRMLLGLTRPSSGTATIDGRP